MVALRHRHNRYRVDEAVRFRPERNGSRVDNWQGQGEVYYPEAVVKDGRIEVTCPCGKLSDWIPQEKIGLEGPTCREHLLANAPVWLPEAARRYVEGDSVMEMANEYGAPPAKVYRWLSKWVNAIGK